MRIGCLGAAKIAPAALVHPAKVRGGAILTAVAARDRTRAEAFAKEHGFARTEPDYAALIAADDIELIYNPLPISLHAPWSIKALEAGKHVLCEKPFAMNIAEARAVLDAARASGRRVIEAFHYRYHPGFRQLLAWVGAGAIGEVKTIAGEFNVTIANPDGAEIRHLPETGGGAFMDLGCYPLSWTLMVMAATPAKVEARASLTAGGVDEGIQTVLEFAGGARAELAASMAPDQRFVARFSVTGSEGTISFANPMAPQYGSRLTLETAGGAQTVRVGRISTYTWQLDAVIDALETGDTLPTEGEAILRQQETLDRIYEAAGLRHLRYRAAA